MGAGLDNRTVRNRRFRGFTGMDDEPEITAIDVDELWLREWAGKGWPSSDATSPSTRPSRTFSASAAMHTRRTSSPTGYQSRFTGRDLRRSGRQAANGSDSPYRATHQARIASAISSGS